MYAQISAHLRSLLLNPAWRDKDLTVAQKLRLDLKSPALKIKFPEI
jgi:hypothetical protein